MERKDYTVTLGSYGFWVVPVRRFLWWKRPDSIIHGHYCNTLEEARELIKKLKYD